MTEELSEFLQEKGWKSFEKRGVCTLMHSSGAAFNIGSGNDARIIAQLNEYAPKAIGLANKCSAASRRIDEWMAEGNGKSGTISKEMKDLLDENGWELRTRQSGLGEIMDPDGGQMKQLFMCLKDDPEMGFSMPEKTYDPFTHQMRKVDDWDIGFFLKQNEKMVFGAAQRVKKLAADCSGWAKDRNLETEDEKTPTWKSVDNRNHYESRLERQMEQRGRGGLNG